MLQGGARPRGQGGAGRAGGECSCPACDMDGPSHCCCWPTTQVTCSRRVGTAFRFPLVWHLGSTRIKWAWYSLWGLESKAPPASLTLLPRVLCAPNFQIRCVIGQLFLWTMGRNTIHGVRACLSLLGQGLSCRQIYY